MSSTYLQSKVMGGLIAKRVVKRLGQVPETVSDADLELAAKEVQAEQKDRRGSIETAKIEAMRLLKRARQMGSLSSAMDAYKRELRQLHEAEQEGGAFHRRKWVQASPFQAGVAIGNAVAFVAIAAYVELAIWMSVLLWLPTVFVFFFWKRSRLRWSDLAIGGRRSHEAED